MSAQHVLGMLATQVYNALRLNQYNWPTLLRHMALHSVRGLIDLLSMQHIVGGQISLEYRHTIVWRYSSSCASLSDSICGDCADPMLLKHLNPKRQTSCTRGDGPVMELIKTYCTRLKPVSTRRICTREVTFSDAGKMSLRAKKFAYWKTGLNLNRIKFKTTPVAHVVCPNLPSLDCDVLENLLLHQTNVV